MEGDLSGRNVTAMDEARRLKEYYDRTATQARWVFYALTMLRVVLTACIPVVALVAPQRSNPVLFGSLGASVLVIEAMVAMVEPGKKWRRYRAADMAIESEMRLTGPKRSTTPEWMIWIRSYRSAWMASRRLSTTTGRRFRIALRRQRKGHGVRTGRSLPV